LPPPAPFFLAAELNGHRADSLENFFPKQHQLGFVSGFIAGMRLAANACREAWGAAAFMPSLVWS
jgi:hypothetical protein